MAGAVRRLIFLLLFLMGLVDMVENVLPICQPSTYTTNSTFDHNLQRLLASLTNYYNTTVVKSGDQVHGTIACRADIICAADTTFQIVRLCPNKREALLSAHHCIMYYFDANFTIPDWVENIALPSPGAIPNPNQFMPQLSSFLQKLAASAIVNLSDRFF
ncbi:hypothetical protein EJ110_NYTH40154 [Nymphaea thermarum]|nr:hypothetical protein EJ110_NYTH40154 [Nymphaea thermarum]